MLATLREIITNQYEASLRTIDRTGHTRSWCERPCVMTSPFTPFFCVVKVRETDVHANNNWVLAVRMSTGMLPTYSLTSRTRKGSLSRITVCSPGRIRKKKPMQHISATQALPSFGVVAVYTISTNACINWIGTGLTL